MTKILFLDVDGVICHERSHAAFGSGYHMREWDPTGCAMLVRLCERRGVKIVMSSTWRHDENLGELNPRLQKHGLDVHLFQPDWRTPDFRNTPFRYEVRGAEIKIWLLKHPEVTRYLILDDFNDFLADQYENLILIEDPDEGLTSHDLNRMDQYFSKEE